MSRFETRIARTERDWEMVADLLGPVFGGDEFARLVRTYQPHDPGPAVARFLADGERAIAHVRMVPRRSRIGAATFQTAAVSCVATHPGYRGQGLNQRLMSETLVHMRETGCQLSIMFGIEDYYQQFGYAVAIPRYRVTVRTDEARRAGRKTNGAVRPIRPDDLPALMALHEAGESDAVGSVVRDGAVWNWYQVLGRFHQGFVVEHDGRPVAYALTGAPEHGQLPVRETAAADDDATGMLLWELVSQAERAGCVQITGEMPPEAPLAAYLFRNCNAEHCQDSYRSSHGMAMILDLHGAMEGMQPEFSRRLSLVEFGARGYIRVETEIGQGALSIAPGSTRWGRTGEGDCLGVLRVSQGQMARLLLGAEMDPCRFLQEGSLAGMAACRVLFAKRNSFVWPLDRV